MELIRKEQQSDQFSKRLLDKIRVSGGEPTSNIEGTARRSSAALRLAKFASIGNLLFRVTEASGPREGYDSARVYIPTSLRVKIIRKHHTSVLGVHRNEKATFADIVALYWWPSTDKDVHAFVRDCSYCELAKGTKPSRQGFLQGCWRHNAAMRMVTMDLVGPIGARESGHVQHVVPLHILVITDPFFSHAMAYTDYREVS